MDGFLNVDKPKGLTSHDVVARLRHLIPRTRIGHTGTLDPMATGVLPVCLGRATKVAHLIMDTNKIYRASVRLGEATDTQDATGRVLRRADEASLAAIDAEKIRGLIPSFIGAIEQVPPMFSAVKVGGRPLYKAARAGIEVARPPRTVRIFEIRFLSLDASIPGPHFDLEIACSKGTYVRTLCADLGDKLGVGAHLTGLVRLRSGPFEIGAAVTLEGVEDLVRADQLGSRIVSIEAALAGRPAITVTTDGARRIQNGRSLVRSSLGSVPKEFKTGDHLLVYDSAGRIIALAQAVTDGGAMGHAGLEQDLFRPERVLN